jgi:hypothetical protein
MITDHNTLVKVDYFSTAVLESDEETVDRRIL